jgi:lysozyme
VPKINEAGLELIEKYEGFSLRAYPDPGTGAEPYTIGWGHTANVHPGFAINKAQAVTFLENDLQNAEAEVEKLVEVDLSPNQFAALVSFQYNTGALAGSTLLKMLNQKNFMGAAGQFGAWVYADGQVLQGLVARRAAEKALFLTP